MMEPYSPCLCGSGKAFKWCCQPYYSLFDKAMTQHKQGQHEAALRTADQMTTQFPTIPQVWGYKAQMLLLNGKVEPAEEALEKAFTLDPNFPFGFYLRAVLRQQEGEGPGALLLFRKAAEAYPTTAHEMLAEIYSVIANLELQLNRPVASHAAMMQAAVHDPADQELRQALDTIFGNESRIPEPARRKYTFRKPDETRAEAWKASIGAAEAGKLTEARGIFEQITAKDPADSAAAFNLGLINAWQGRNREALEALYRSIEVETDDFRAAEAGALAEVLRCGNGMDEFADYHDHQIYFRILQGDQIVPLLQELERKDRLVGIRSDPENNSLTGLILEDTATLGLSGASMARLAAQLFIVGGVMRLSHTREESLNKVAAELSLRLPGAIQEAQRRTGIANWGDVVTEALMFPLGEGSAIDMEAKIREQAQDFFEEKWLYRPLRTLDGKSPSDAAGDASLRKRLGGIIRFIEACFTAVKPSIQEGENVHRMSVYDFDRLRRKLGLVASNPADSKARPDLALLSVAELGLLQIDELNETELEKGFQAAMKLDAPNLAASFARSIVTRFAQGDRYPFWNHLVLQAQKEGIPEKVLQILAEAEQADATGNEGRRRNDFRIQRAKLLAKSGDKDAAFAAFEEVIAANPDELKYYATAVESLLSLKQGPRAVKLAEEGLAKARSKNSRDWEGNFMELLSAAKRLG